jgi:hypothetical protein
MAKTRTVMASILKIRTAVILLATLAASTGSSTSGSSDSHSATSTASTTTQTKSAGVKDFDTGGIAQWALVALTALVAVGVGSLIV